MFSNLSVKAQDLVLRALHTFWQAFLAVFSVGLVNVFTAFQKNIGTGKAAAVSLVVAAVAAGLSALKTAYLQRKV